jgi:hypothetical protein
VVGISAATALSISNGTVMVFLQQLQLLSMILIGTAFIALVNYQDGEKAYVIAKMVCKRSEHSFW